MNDFERSQEAPAIQPQPRASIRETLRHKAFRTLLAGGSAYFIGNAMQAMAAAWLMIEITGSSFLAALVQTAVFLPMFLLSLPAGVLADTTDRRRMVLTALSIQMALVALMAVLFLLELAGAGLLLLLTFFIGCCSAMMSPAWNSSIVDVVPREELPQAITAVGISYNAARALGPALAGWVYLQAGVGWVFVLTMLGVLSMYASLRRFPPRPHSPSRLPAERLWGGILSALRFARHSRTVLAQMVRTVAFSIAASALWALLPAVGYQQLGLDAAGFGLLMACMGGGSVLAGLVLGPMRIRLGLEGLVSTGCVVFAVVMVIAAISQTQWLTYAALVAGGGASMSVLSTYNTATQTSVPPWVRARATAMHLICAFGSFALGAVLWGAVSDGIGLTFALLLGASVMAAGLFLARPFPLRMSDLDEVTQVALSQDFVIPDHLEPDAGPVAVEIIYCVRPDRVDVFLNDASLLRAPRRRDGATFWRLYRDLSDPTRYVERFIVASWADYLHQRARATLADQDLEAKLIGHLMPDVDAPIPHLYLAER